MYNLVFAQSDVMACCCAKNHKFIKYYKMSEQEKFDFYEYEKIRTYYISQFKQDIIPEGCVGCPFIEQKDWNEKIEYKNIVVANRTKCSCDCIYCSLLEGEHTILKKKDLNTRKTYDIKPILLSLQKNNCISSDANIQIAGGEPTEYPQDEFSWLLHFIVDNNYSVEVLSSGINFSKELEKVLMNNKVKLIISPDAGTKATYEKIKRVKSFNKVWKNIQKYCKATKKNTNGFVFIKYIIIPDVNDNIPEISKFIEQCKKVSCKNIIFSLDFNWYEKNKDKKLYPNMEKIIKYLFSDDLHQNYSVNIDFEQQLKKWFFDQYEKIRGVDA